MFNYKNLKPFKVFSPGDHLRNLLEENNWTQNDLAEIMSVSQKHINEIIQNKQALTIENAVLLSKVFGLSPEFWINTYLTYKLQNIEQSEKCISVMQKTELYKIMPIGEMIKREWIARPNNYIELIDYINTFWGETEISEAKIKEKQAHIYLKKNEENEIINIAHATTWVQMLKNLSAKISSNPYSKEMLRDLIDNIHSYLLAENGIASFLNALENAGVKIIQLNHLSKTYLDGAAYFDELNPVVVFTCRVNRLDNFIFTLVHEIAHILLHLEGKGKIAIDDEKMDRSTQIELEADNFTIITLQYDRIAGYFEGKSRYVSIDNIIKCAQEFNIHKNVVVGALAYYKIIEKRRAGQMIDKALDYIPQKYITGK